MTDTEKKALLLTLVRREYWLETDGTPTRVERWYDRQSRNWITQLMDENDYQMKASIDGTRQDAVVAERHFNDIILAVQNGEDTWLNMADELSDPDMQIEWLDAGAIEVADLWAGWLGLTKVGTMVDLDLAILAVEEAWTVKQSREAA